tara:strand:+ start:8675 stop:9373 length:699 start_codon:yes stop_codon:yes gene_type:complete
MPTPPTPDTGADFTNQFISDKYTSLLHLSGAKLTSELATDQTAHGVYDGVGNYTGMGVTTDNISFNNITMPKSVTDTTLVDYLFPIGSIFLSFDDVNPGERMPGAGQGDIDTVWECVSKGLFLAGIGEGTDVNDNVATITAGDTNNGEYTHTLTTGELPPHKHGVEYYKQQKINVYGSNQTDMEVFWSAKNPGAVTGAHDTVPTDDPTGELAGDAVNNMPPSYGIYVWKRIS